ncbi:hypothetical protein ASD43_05800 [Microbacterium sp. Root553]|nr:hypothetical protein ASD43_05800 [Microbacterium sp. Root553]
MDSVAATTVNRVMAEFALAFLRTELLAPGTRHTLRPPGTDDARASDRAERLRREWDMSPSPVRQLVRLLETHGII